MGTTKNNCEISREIMLLVINNVYYQHRAVGEHSGLFMKKFVATCERILMFQHWE